MIETIYFISGILTGTILIIIGGKINKRTIDDAVTDYTQPIPQYRDEDRTQSINDTDAVYDYDNYDEYLKFNPDNIKKEKN